MNILNFNPSKTTVKIDHLLQEGNYYYLLLNDQTLVPKDIIEKVKNKELLLIIDLSYEGWTQSADIVYNNYIIPHNLDSDDIILLSGSVTAQEDTNTFCNKVNIKPFKSIWALPMERDIALEVKNKTSSLYHNNILKFHKRKNKSFNKCYLNFNRRWRYHRPALVGLLKARNLLDKGYVSLSHSDDNINWETAYDKVTHLNRHHKKFIDIWTSNENLIKSIPNLTLDFNDLTENKANLDLSADYYYDNSYFSVVNETNFYQEIAPAKFFSEKTFKPIAFKHPFILVSVPNSLPVLRQLGYQTFSPYIDESYDNETNDSERLFKIVNEIERLSALKGSELSDFITNTYKIVDHNYKNLMNRLL